MFLSFEPFLETVQVDESHRSSATARTDQWVFGFLLGQTDPAYLLLNVRFLSFLSQEELLFHLHFLLSLLCIYVFEIERLVVKADCFSVLKCHRHPSFVIC